jgi:hypothetical protein
LPEKPSVDRVGPKVRPNAAATGTPAPSGSTLSPSRTAPITRTSALVLVAFPELILIVGTPVPVLWMIEFASP